MSGCIAGAIQTIVVSPAELVKCKLQVQQHRKADSTLRVGGARERERYRGPMDCARKVVAAQGVMGLYQGVTATVLREVPAFGIYFGFYEVGKETCVERLGMPPTKASALAGGVSGALSWAVTFPVDYAKSVIQTLPLDAPPHQRHVWGCLRQTFVSHGARFMFRGLGVALSRAFVVNACVFPVYEKTLNILLPTTPPNGLTPGEPWGMGGGEGLLLGKKLD
ncbi:unnamed protein product [Choristocarpus tenellus]